MAKESKDRCKHVKKQLSQTLETGLKLSDVSVKLLNIDKMTSVMWSVVGAGASLIVAALTGRPFILA